MEIEDWWPLLSAETRRWLIDNNGDVLPEHISDRIVAVGGPDDEFLSDDDVDWIEARANDEEA